MNRTEAIKAELERIRQENGGLLRQQDIVDAARPEDSPLHDEFTWDDGEAAELYRLHEAGVLTRRVKVKLNIAPAGEPPQIIRPRVYHSLPEDRHKAGGYRSLADIRADPEKRAQLLEQVRAELAALRQKYAHLDELNAVWIQIDALATAEERPAA